jgi:transposase
MPRKESSKLEQRIRFAVTGRREGLNVVEAFRRFSISRQTGYKLIR